MFSTIRLPCQSILSVWLHDFLWYFTRLIQRTMLRPVIPFLASSCSVCLLTESSKIVWPIKSSLWALCLRQTKVEFWHVFYNFPFRKKKNGKGNTDQHCAPFIWINCCAFTFDPQLRGPSNWRMLLWVSRHFFPLSVLFSFCEFNIFNIYFCLYGGEVK